MFEKLVLKGILLILKVLMEKRVGKRTDAQIKEYGTEVLVYIDSELEKE